MKLKPEKAARRKLVLPVAIEKDKDGYEENISGSLLLKPTF
jgi:hypothetical protein